MSGHFLRYIPLAVFALLGALVQIPVFFVQATGPAPNLPISLLSVWLIYINISTFINHVSWTSTDVDTWWEGAGWCDLDTTVYESVSTGIMLTVVAISCHLYYLSRPTTKRLRAQDIRRWRIFDVLCCTVIPAASLIVHPFNTPIRYIIIGGVGCRGVIDISHSEIVFSAAIPLLIFVVVLAINCGTLLQFYWRGTEGVYQAISFKERLSVNFFIRSIVCCVCILVVGLPFAMYVAVTTLTKAGLMQPIAWINGKPETWDSIVLYTYDEAIDNPQMRGPIIASLVFRGALMVISFVAFFCFGTGSSAVLYYRNPWFYIKHCFTGKPAPLVSPTSPASPASPTDSEYTVGTSNEKDKMDMNIHVTQLKVKNDLKSKFSKVLLDRRPTSP